jgi:hypothetical protein
MDVHLTGSSSSMNIPQPCSYELATSAHFEAPGVNIGHHWRPGTNTGYEHRVRISANTGLEYW